MNEYDYDLAKKALDYILSGDFELAEDIFKNYSGDLIDEVYSKYVEKLFYEKQFNRHYYYSYIYRHTVSLKNDPRPPYRKYCKYLKKFDQNDKDKRLLICGAMPLGDQIFFTRFLSVILDITKNITVITLPRLVDHFTNAFPDVRFVEDDSQIIVDNFDCVLFMPFTSKFAFDKNNLPIKRLEPTATTNAERVNKLRLRPEVRGKTIIGFSWKSARNEHRDYNDIGSAKSLMVKQLLPFFDIPNTVFVNLQHGDFQEELDTFIEKYKVYNIVTFKDLDMKSTTQHILDYVDMCDYIIGPTNTLIHMAGALHKKTFTFVPRSGTPGRLWMYHSIPKDRVHSFYPTVKMYEQDQLLSWETAIEIAKEDLLKEM